MASKLNEKRCTPCTGREPPLPPEQVSLLLAELDGWLQYDRLIGKTFEFKDHYQTMAFVNAVAWVSHREDHHPEMTVGYNKCHLEYTTHAIGGLSENDFICAAKVDALFRI